MCFSSVVTTDVWTRDYVSRFGTQLFQEYVILQAFFMSFLFALQMICHMPFQSCMWFKHDFQIEADLWGAISETVGDILVINDITINSALVKLVSVEVIERRFLM